MSAWPGKYVIGLTGNIATGKSVVRKMLEHLGAYGIDADALAHRATAKGAPGYEAVVELFGNWILEKDGQIDRARLGRLVFSDPDALKVLEQIVHPLVSQAIDILIRRSPHRVIVVEAIKLVESGLASNSDSLWVTYSPAEVQLDRLMRKRGMNEEAALQRIQVQPPQEEKIKAADVVIRNTGSFEDTWKQVASAWQRTIPILALEEEEPSPLEGASPPGERFQVRRAKPSQAAEIARLIEWLSGGSRKLSRVEVMEAFGEKAYLLLYMNGKPAGLIGWKVENLVARTDEVYLAPSVPRGEALVAVMQEVERASTELQCEVSLLFLPAKIARHSDLVRTLKYEVRSIPGLGVRAWQEAAEESMPRGTVMLFKQLREDRVLRPV